MKKIVIFILISIVITSCNTGEHPSSVKKERPVVKNVRIEQVIPEEADIYYETSGIVRSRTTSRVGSRIMGTVSSVMIEEGEVVGKGQLLMTLDGERQQQRLKTAEQVYQEALNNLDLAAEKKRLSKITFSRYKNLYDEDAISGQEMDEIEVKRNIAVIEHERATAGVEQALANLKDARITYGFSRIKSPVNGIVAEKYVDEGTLVTPGTPLVTIEDNSSYRLEANVNEQLLKNITTGQTVSIHIVSLDQKLEGQISEIVKSVDPETRTFVIKVELNNPQLKNGLYASISVPYDKIKKILVPAEAVVRKGQLEGVYQVDEQGVISYALVKTGRLYEKEVEILSGLKEGDRIIVENAGTAVDGGVVEQRRQ